MAFSNTETNTCPKCGHTFQGYSALSRVDNRTERCPDCGIREAMEDAGIGPWTRREIMTRMIKERYKPGMRDRLLKMTDKQVPLVGTLGSVRGVDDIGSVMVAWDNGYGLNVILDGDKIEVIG